MLAGIQRIVPKFVRCKVSFELPIDKDDDDNEMTDCVRKYLSAVKTNKTGLDIVHDPLYNKGTGFKHIERDRLGLRGLVPPRRLKMKIQLEKLYNAFQKEEDPLRKNMFLADLQNRNETLFFCLLIENIQEMGMVFIFF